MNGNDLHSFFQKLNPDLWLTETCDGFKFGDQTTEIKGTAVTWMATMSVIETAISHGHNFIVTHEPTFYNLFKILPFPCPKSRDRDQIEDFENDLVYRKKIDYLSRNNMVVYRLHDTWDTLDAYGILDSWATALSFNKMIAFDGHHKVYEISPIPLGELGKQIKRRMKLKCIRIVGKLESIARKIGLGVGAWGTIDNLKACMKMGADVFVTGETCEWQTVRFAEDCGIAMIVVGHINSENFGMRNLARFLRNAFPHLNVEFIDAEDPYHYL